MITFKNKKVLIISSSSILIEEISLKFTNHGAIIIFIDKNNHDLKKKISDAIKFDNRKFDIFIYYDRITENSSTSYQIENLININLYIEFLEFLSKKENSTQGVNVLNITSNILYPKNLSKILSLKYLERNIRVNNLLIDENTSLDNIEKISYMALFLLSNNAKFIVGESYDIKEIKV